MYKKRLLQALFQTADQITKDAVNNLSEDQVKTFCDRIDKDISKQTGATPRTYLLEVRSTGDGLSYKLLFETELWSSLSLQRKPSDNMRLIQAEPASFIQGKCVFWLEFIALVGYLKMLCQHQSQNRYLQK